MKGELMNKTSTGKTKKATKKGTKGIGRGLYIILSIIFLLASVCINIYFIYIKEPTIKEVIKEKIVEHVQYVEKSKTPTSEFLTYLNPKLDPTLAKLIGIEVDKASEKYLLPRTLICAVMRKESNINPFAKSSAGAIGLMQVMPKVHKERFVDRNLWHISTNVDVGAQIWREYFDNSEGHIGKTFHAYLSKRAKKIVAKQYQNEIEGFWAKLIMHDYLTTMEREKAKEIFVEEVEDIEQLPTVINPLQPEYPVDDVSEHKSGKSQYK